MLDLALLDELGSVVAAIDQLRLRATLDPAKAQVPGVLVRLDAIEHDYASAVLSLRLFVIAADNDVPVALRDLQEAHNRLAPMLDELGGVVGRIELGTTTLPGVPAPLPALVIPVTVTITP